MKTLQSPLPRPKCSSHICGLNLPSHAKATTASNRVDNFENESVVKTYSSLEAICFNSDKRKPLPIPMVTMVTFCFLSKPASC